jgi:UDP-glucose 4-epimerase
MKVLVTGGAGYIGSIVTEALIREGYEAVVYDNLAKGHRDAVIPPAEFIQGNLLDEPLLQSALRGVEAVVHLAADSLVGESMADPSKYYRNNVQAGLSLLDGMLKCGVRRLVFSSSAAVYGEPAKQPIEETDPIQPTNPYGETKWAFERALQWYGRAYGFHSVSLRYFNAAGASARNGERHDPETHLIPLVLDVAIGRRPAITIFGDDYPTKDGTCIRDYIHVEDLADAHILALRAVETGPARSPVYNLGSGGGRSVYEVVQCAREVTGRPIPTIAAARRSGDPSVLVASPARARSELGWHTQQEDLFQIISSAWKWMNSRTRQAA